MEQAKINISFMPRRWQQECIDNMTRFSVWALHRRAGKTTLAINLLRNYALKKVGTYVYVAPFLKQAKEIAWSALREVAKDFQHVPVGNGYRDLVTVRESEYSLIFWNGSVIRLAGADNPDALRGNKLAGAVLDEVAQMSREVWSEVIQPALLDSNGWAIFIGTPKGINLFSELFFRGDDPAFKPDWSNARYTCYQTDALTPEQIAVMKRDLSPEAFKREMLCDFGASAADQLISLDEVMTASQRRVEGAQLSRYEPVIGVDVARYGDDSSVIVVRRGLVVESLQTYKNLDIVSLAEQVAQTARTGGIKTIYVDGTGVGGGVPDVLRAMGLHPFDINFGQRSAESLYANKRSEMWCKMAEWIRGGGCIPASERLVKELAAPTYEKDEDGKIKLENKKKIKERLGFSPDLGDALALTFCNWVPEINASAFENPFDVFVHKTMPQTPIQRFENKARSRHASFARAFSSSIVPNRVSRVRY